ncbi:hypothetical protein J4558_13825 [Leptolyngbya sp. 15MV]|nr:hypothetical protein J4558_13825 [Leptolyngbya sp. 15MV]
MHIALTYDLADDYLAAGFTSDDVAEFDSKDVIDALDAAIVSLGHTTERVGSVGPLIDRLARGQRWDLVFNIAEGLSSVGGVAREAQIPTILDLYGIPYTFSPPLPLAIALDKALAKRLIRDHGIPTPSFTTIASVEEAAATAALASSRTSGGSGPGGKSAKPAEEARPRLPGSIKRLDLPLFAKPVAEGSSKGVTTRSIIRAWPDLVPTCTDLLERFRQPVLLERYLPGRELTVGILGTGDRARCIGAMEIHLNDRAEPGLYSFDNKEHWQDRMTFSLAQGPIRDECFSVALAAYRALGCRDAARVDLRQDPWKGSRERSGRKKCCRA